MQRRLLYFARQWRSAEKLVVIAEDVRDQESKDDAQELVDLLPNGQKRRELQARLDAIIISTNTAPTAPTNIQAVRSGSTSIISWTASSDAEGLAGYNLYMNGVKKNTSLITGTSFNVTDADLYTLYQLTVQAVDLEGLTATSAPFQFLIKPPAPTGLTVTTVSSSSLSLNWNDNGIPGTTYLVYRKAGSCTNFNYTLVASGITQSAFVDTNLASGQFYCYSVTAVVPYAHWTANSNESTRVSGVTTETTPPTAPSGLSIRNNATDPTRVSWLASYDNVGVVGYEVYCKANLEDEFFKWNTSLITDLFYDFEGIGKPLGGYYTKVRALDAAGNFADSEHIPNYFNISRTT